ncbi:nibrin [Labrus mixtus]|uniref:nibrin n=1 Tax=Labrus mixtus TaxID=508554 RepID=UPI0029C0C941|nr:nibrin [Labrus mixtus]
MWILTPLQSEGETYYLVSSKEYVVGRKNCDIILTSDQSISRAHAHLTATDQTLTLKDTSKYGTFVNSQRLTENTPVNLKSRDEVTFGVFHSKFSVVHLKPVVCSSCLDNDGKASLSQALSALGGNLVNTWTEDCTHLVMPTAKVTIKTISALLCCRPIVKPEFFSELSKAAQQKKPPPKAESFIPEIDEPSLSKEDVNLGAIQLRKQLFAGKTFVFLSAKQMKRLSAAVSFGGGRSRLLEENRLPKDLLESQQSCVVDTSTGSSQTLLPSSANEWANSVKNIVQRKGLRVITESEIGLAAIYASCDKYCNPCSLIPDSAPKVPTRIPSASLSQSTAVDETVLPAASQNITAYAANTETSQRTQRCVVTEVTAVGETPEKKQSSQFGGSKPEAQKKTSQCVVDDTMSSSFNTFEKTDSERKRPESKPTVSGESSGGLLPQPSFLKPQKTFVQMQSPQKQRVSAQASPQKQSTLTTFFQPVNKKRPLEDDLSAVMSEPKRPVLESSSRIQKQHSSVESSSRSERVPAVTSQESAAALFVVPPKAESHRVSHSIQDGPRSGKRKEMEAEIQMDELESIMSEDMDFFDEPPSGKRVEQARSVTTSSTEQKHFVNTGTTSSISKRQRINVEEHERIERPQTSLQEESGSKMQHNKPSGNRTSIKTEQVSPEYRKSYQCQDLKQLKGDICQPKEEKPMPLKPVTIKQEVQESKVDEDLPQKLVLVEFRSLTVTVTPKNKPQRMTDNGFTKNFKRFRKMNVPGAQGQALTHIIGGSDLLVHNRGKNSDLDEWLKDAAEEERQSKQDESVGDDLFRYNPTKLTRRR